MEILISATALRQQITEWKRTGSRVGLVPTMGALHEGHLALVRRATALADNVTVSIFVNPTQFAPHEDFERYPRDTERDADLLQSAGCDLLFLPETETLYPAGHCTYVDVEGVSEGLEGAVRPGHFRGVATVVTKLFHLVQPDVAVFGEKDAQQLAVIRRLVEDLHLPVTIDGVPTVREADGLALSSRNAYLDEEDRQAATILSRALFEAQRAIEAGERSADAIRALLKETLASEPRLDLDYADVVDASTFRPVEYLDRTIVIPVAGRLGETRLIDNLSIDTTNLT